MALDITQIMSSIGDMVGLNRTDDAAIAANFRSAGEAIKSAQGQLAQDAADAGTVEAAKQAGILQKQARIAETNNALDWDNLRVQLAEQMTAQGRQLAELDAAIAKDDSVSFFDNPVLWLGAQIAREQKVGAYNATARSYNLNEQRMATANSFSQQTAATANAAIETVTADSAAAAQRVAGAQYRLQGVEMSLKALANDTEALRVMRSGRADELNLMLKQYELNRGEEEWTMRKQSFDMQKQQFADSRRMFQLQLQNAEREATSKGQALQYQEQVLAMANEGAKHIGRRPFTSFADYEAFRSVKGNQDLSEQLLEIGYQRLDIAMNKNGVGAVQVAPTPADVGLLLTRTRGQLADPKLTDLLTTTFSAGLAGTLVGPNGQPVDRKNPAAVLDAVNHALTKKAAADRLNITAGGDDNLYAPPTGAELEAAMGGVDRMPAFYKTLVAPVVKANPTQKLTPEFLYMTALNATLNGQIKLEEAVQGMKDVSTLAATSLNATRNYKSVGLPQLGSYRGKVKMPGMYFAQDIDLTDETLLRNKFIGAVGLNRYRNSFSMPEGSPQRDMISPVMGEAFRQVQNFGNPAVGVAQNLVEGFNSSNTATRLNSLKAIDARGNAYDFDVIGMSRSQVKAEIARLEKQLGGQ